MICQHCGAALPPIAMFCGECGRSVAARSPVVPPVTLTSAAMPFSASEPLSITPATPPEPDDPPLARPVSVPTAPLAPASPRLAAVPEAAGAPTATPVSPVAPPRAASADGDRLAEALRPGADSCPRCGTAADPGDIFCGTCGESLTSPHDATIARPTSATVATPSSAPATLAWSLGSTGSVPSAPRIAHAPLAVPPPPDAATSAPAVAPGPARAPEPAPPAVAPAPLPSPPPAPLHESTLDPDTENTRLVPRGSTGARFVLQFSTGESYTVLGSGIIGRNPAPEPGEAVDHIVTIVDPGRSVSKSHLEFGQDNGVFWVSDRHSGNGSVIREPGSDPRYCEPGRRYRVVRGTRIDIGEQFVIVS